VVQLLARAGFVVAALLIGNTASLPADAAETTFRECRWTNKPLVIDGVADEAAWKEAATIEDFSFPWIAADATARRLPTKTKLLWDREFLYWFAEMEDRDLFGSSDSISLFVKPADDKPGYYEFQCNVDGRTRAKLIAKRGEAGKHVPTAERDAIRFDAKVVVHGTFDRHDDADEGWTMEGRIAWRDLLRTGGRPLTGETWKVAIGRQDQATGGNVELSTSARLEPTDRTFHRYEDYDRLRFVGPSTAVASRLLGLEVYRPVASSHVVGSPDPPPPFRAVRTMPALRLNFPIAVACQPNDRRLLLIDQKADSNSRILRVAQRDDAKEVEVLLDLHDIAYGIAFHPQFGANGFVYIGSNGAAPGGKRTRVTRYTMARDATAKLDPASALVVIDWPSDGHNGGDMAFGKDGTLFVTSGDGTSDSDANVVGQDLTRLTAKVLRIDVDHPATDKLYSVPADNPFVGVKVGKADARPETWAHGLRNPWRITVDRQTGAVWVGNNGQDLWEQAFRIERGANYGWSAMEGSHAFYADRRPPDAIFTPPTVEHSHAEFRSLTGGVVYYGARFPELRGAYIYGDYSTGKIWGIFHDGKTVVWHKELADTTLAISGFGVDADGELLICDHRGNRDGGLYQLEKSPPRTSSPADFPKRLSETGLFASVGKHQLQSGAIPYSVNAPLWSDGAFKERYLVLPPAGDRDPAHAAPIDFAPRGSWTIPDRTVLVKSFALPPSSAADGSPAPRRWIETRLLTRQEGEWVGYSYRWNDEQTDAALVDAAGADASYPLAGGKKLAWHYPSRAECMVCHSRAANFVLGLSTEQLNRPHDYAAGKSNQLELFERLGLLRVDWRSAAVEQVRQDFSDAKLKGGKLDDAVARHTDNAGQREAAKSTLLAREPASYARLADPADAGAPLGARARSYLHANCAQCHVQAGGGNAQINLSYFAGSKERNVSDVKPLHHALGIADPRLVAPGDAGRSVLLARMARRGAGQMPPLASSAVDEQGVELIRRWIDSGAGE
jgi:uncharacterized repeat protein (TIGR03806 family)